jgi:diguanylate cyclase (GGDEF)-like protein
LIRLIAFMLFALFGAAPSVAIAAPVDGNLSLANPCFILGAPNADATHIIKGDARFDCARDPRKAEADTIWVRYDLSKSEIDGSVGWTYDHGLIQARDEQVWIAYADGRIRKSATKREDARRVLGGSTQRYEFVAEPGRIVSLLVRVDGLQNRRGPVPRAALTSASQTSFNIARYYLMFGLMAGIMFGILFYNATLFAALRYRMLAAYCGSIAMSMFYGFVGSNLILWFAPGISTASQFGWNVFAISLSFLMATLYFREFIEEGMVPLWLVRIITAVGTLASALSVTRIHGEILPWRIFDAMIYTCYAAIVALSLVTFAIAWRRGSRAIKFYMLAWIGPLAITVARMLWGIGGVTVESALFDSGTFISLCLEGLLSAIGLSWRLGQLRNERDKARVQADELYMLANIDPLTGIANRRAFHGRALWAGAKGKDVQLILIDVDRFKFVNDGFGHDAGDIVLRRIARALQSTGVDVIGRLGGDEFALIVETGNAAEVGAAIAHHLLTNMRPDDLGVTVSMGVASGPLVTEQDWQLLYIAADKALYESKRGGRAQLTDAATPQESVPVAA